MKNWIIASFVAVAWVMLSTMPFVRGQGILLLAGNGPNGGGGGFPSSGLVGWWKMDEASGSAIDAHTNNYDLTQSGTVGSSTSDGPDSDSTVRTFDGTASFTITDAASGGNLDPVGGSFTVAGWAYGNSTMASSGNFILFAKKQNSTSEGWSMKFGTNIGSTQIRLNSAHQQIEDGAGNNISFATEDFVATDTWFHWALVLDRTGSTLKFYANGSELQSVSASGLTDDIDTTRAVYLGSQETFSGWEGKLARTGYWSRALSASEVSDLYNSGSFLDP